MKINLTQARFLASIAITWSLFQLWFASPLPYLFGFGIFNDTEARSIHLGFSVFLVYLFYPFGSKERLEKPFKPIDILFSLTATFCATYLYIFYQDLAARSGAPTQLDVIVAITGIILLLMATRRALGLPLTIVATVFLLYSFAGPYMPEVLAHKGASLNRVASHQWLTTEGVFGVALSVSTNFVFLFVLFGAMLQATGAGQYFIRVAFSLLGHLRGGPVKASVLASGMTGLMSGSSIANVVTTGTFTIPLMKRVGFPPHKAGAIEVAASTDGQILPPAMGAAAFLMVEYTNTPYIDIIKHAFLPAILSNLALLYLVHLEAIKADMRGLPKRVTSPLRMRIFLWVFNLSSIIILTYLVYHLIAWINQLFGAASIWIIAVSLMLIYLALLWHSTRFPETEDLEADTLTELPEASSTIQSGLHFLLPVITLIWCLMVLRLSPGLSAFYAIAVLIFILLTQRPLSAFFRKQAIAGTVNRGINDLFNSLREGAENMVSIGVATATAGIVVGTVSLTGVGQVLTEVVEIISMGSVFLVLLFTGLLCMVLGMGLPTTANYIVVSTLMAPVVVTLGQAHGLEIPLVAVHLFVFYFGILADDTPPVGLAAFAAAGIAKSDPIKTGLQSFSYDVRTAILPFMFIFNTEMLMMGISHWAHALWVIMTCLAAMLLFVSVTQNYFLTRNRWWEILILLLVVFSLFRPGYWRDTLFPAYQTKPLVELTETIQTLEPNQHFRLYVEVDSGLGTPQRRYFLFSIPADAQVESRLEDIGLAIEVRDKAYWISDIGFMSPAESAGLSMMNDNQILSFDIVNVQPAKEWFILPALFLLGIVVISQRRRLNTSK